MFVARGVLEPCDRRLAFLGRAAAAGGVLQTRPRPLERLRVTQHRHEIRVGHPADRPPADAEQIADPLLQTVGAGEERPDRQFAPVT